MSGIVSSAMPGGGNGGGGGGSASRLLRAAGGAAERASGGSGGGSGGGGGGGGSAAEEEALARAVCTFTSSGSTFMDQHWYFCYTCDLTGAKGCCSVCGELATLTSAGAKARVGEGRREVTAFAEGSERGGKLTRGASGGFFFIAAGCFLHHGSQLSAHIRQP